MLSLKAASKRMHAAPRLELNDSCSDSNIHDHALLPRLDTEAYLSYCLPTHHTMRQQFI